MPTALEELSDCDNGTHKWIKRKWTVAVLRDASWQMYIICIHAGIHSLACLADLMLGMCHLNSASSRLCPWGSSGIISPWLTLAISFTGDNHSIDICIILLHFWMCAPSRLYIPRIMKQDFAKTATSLDLTAYPWWSCTRVNKPKRHFSQVASQSCYINWAHRQWQALVLPFKLTVSGCSLKVHCLCCLWNFTKKCP